MTVHIISASYSAVTKWHCTRKRQNCVLFFDWL